MAEARGITPGESRPNDPRVSNPNPEDDGNQGGGSAPRPNPGSGLVHRLDPHASARNSARARQLYERLRSGTPPTAGPEVSYPSPEDEGGGGVGGPAPSEPAANDRSGPTMVNQRGGPPGQGVPGIPGGRGFGG